MNEERIIKISKYLSKHLRHQPERLGLTLAPGGWVTISDLLAACSAHGMHFTRLDLDEVVERNNKQRFSYDDTCTLIRANQGHSVDVDLQLEPVLPPDILFHGTSRQNIDVIFHEGLHRMSRHHVHLSLSRDTARNVGARHGKPVVLQVNAKLMHEEGFQFYCSANGVWLVDSVPSRFLQEEVNGSP